MKNEPAFPMMPSHTNPADVELRFTGLSKRELFAAMVLQGFSANNGFNDYNAERVARLAVEQADALIAELSKEAGRE